MTELKTRPTDQSVKAFIDSVDNETRRDDCRQLLKIMHEITGEAPIMWNSGIVGFGTYHYVYPTGNEGDWMITGFSPRKQSLTIYIMSGFDRYEDLMSKLGNHKNGVSCLYIKRLSDIYIEVLKEVITSSVKYIKAKYST